MNDSDKQKISAILSGLNNLLYETIFIININDGKLSYISNKSEMAKNYDTMPSTLAKLIGKKDSELTELFEAIQAGYNKMDVGNRKDLIFIADTTYNVGVMKRQTITIKLTPLQEDFTLPLTLMIGILSISSSIRTDSLHMFNTEIHKNMIYDFETQTWKPTGFPVLTDLQKQVIFLSAKGLTVPEISPIIFRAPDSVKSIRRRIFEKLGVVNITEAIIYAMNYKLI